MGSNGGIDNLAIERASVATIQHIYVSSGNRQHMCQILMRKGHHAIAMQAAHSSADATTVPKFQLCTAHLS